MDKKSKNTLIVSIIALALVLIGVTYAYFSARITGLESASSLSLTAGRMGIHYSEGDESVLVNNIYPREEAWLTKTITLTGYNTTDQEMRYDLLLNITSNTFLYGELTFDLIGEGENGEKIADITGKSIVKKNGNFKLGTGSFTNADGDTHVYTLKIYFKDNGKDQNYNQEAVFNARLDLKEHGYNIAKANQNHNGKHCYTDNYTPGIIHSDEDEFTRETGQYTYKYNQYYLASRWYTNSNQNGWGVRVTDPSSTDPLTEEFCAFIDEIPVVNMSYMFQMSKAVSVDLSSFDTSNVTNMNAMFSNTVFTSLDLSGFDTSKVTNMGNMFTGINVSALDLSSFDTSNVTLMNGMFSSMNAGSINIGHFDTSKVTNMTGLFSGTSNTQVYGAENFDTSNVISFATMLASTGFTTIDLSTWDTSKVTTMSYLFTNSRARTIDISSWDTSRVTNMANMFNNATALKTIYVSNKFTTDNLEAEATNHGSYRMFYNCTKLVGGAGTTYNSSYIDKVRAHIDGGLSNPGYFTDVRDKPSS